jgi:uroporphyrinogen-III synthase
VILPATGTQPLTGKRIVVTRARRQAPGLVERLRDLGADVVEVPAIEIVPVDSPELDAALARLASYDWILFTSVNAVEIFVERLSQTDGSLASAGQVQVGAIGAATAERLRQHGLAVDFVPDEFVAEAMVAGLTRGGVAGKRILLPRARIARDTLPEGLRAAGATVDVVVVYDTRRPPSLATTVVEGRLASGVDLVTFASPSSVRNIAEMLDAGERAGVAAACIGPITARAAREAGFSVVVQATEYSIPGMVEAIVRYVRGNELPS